MSIESTWKNSLNEAIATLEAFASSDELMRQCQQFSELLISAYKGGHRVFSCGNGGSHCDAMHFAEELTGRYRKDRRPLGALALGDASHTTCVANDYGFEHIFSRQLAGLANPGDVFLGFSTSGNSPNVLKAAETAKEMGLKSVALLGKDGGKLKPLVDLAIVVPAQTSDRIQEMHIKLVHTVIESIERELFPENYR